MSPRTSYAPQRLIINIEPVTRTRQIKHYIFLTEIQMETEVLFILRKLESITSHARCICVYVEKLVYIMIGVL